MAIFRSDSRVVLLRKIVESLGGSPDCCGFDTAQSLLFQLAQITCAGCSGDGPIPPTPPEENLLLLENSDPFELEDGTGGIIVEV